MKKIFYMAIAAAVMMSCVNGKDSKGEHVDLDSLPAPDSVATLRPGSLDFMVAETMQTASYDKFFDVVVTDDGVVKCVFKNQKDNHFSMIFNAADCPSDTIVVKGSVGRCRGVAVMNIGGGVNPALIMLMEDDHAERVSLYNLSDGYTTTTMRSTQGDITMFEQIDAGDNDEGSSIAGISIDGSKIDLDWEEL